MNIRHAQLRDAAAIAEIYNHYVLHTTTTYEEVPETVEIREAWLTNRKPQHPVIVYEENGVVLGWGALSEFKSRSAYRYTVENSIYVKDGHTGRKIGRQILEHLLGLAEMHDIRCILAVISSEHAVSIKLHTEYGFRPCGLIERVAMKFGTWLNVAFMQKNLGD